MAVMTGIDFEHGTTFPASGLKGNLTRFGTIGLDFGVSSMCTIELSGGVHDRLSITSKDPTAPLADMLTATGTTTGDIEDAVIGAKIRLTPEQGSRLSMAVDFSTRLPNAGIASGLGLGTTDFHFSILMGTTVQSLRVVGNVGFGILGDPVQGNRQNDVLLYGVSVARAIAQGAEIVAEINGRANTGSGTVIIGTESRSVMRVGTRYTRGAVRVDAALLIGMATDDPTWGFSTGVTWVFHAFKVP
jgi:hypothetical protein